LIQESAPEIAESKQLIKNVTTRSFTVPRILLAGVSPLVNTNQNIHSFLRKENV
jgi:hypothetical protein